MSRIKPSECLVSFEHSYNHLCFIQFPTIVNRRILIALILESQQEKYNGCWEYHDVIYLYNIMILPVLEYIFQNREYHDIMFI